jgi:phage terminase large subunit-like protein
MSVSPSITQRLSNDIIPDLKAFAAAYHDDIVVFFSKSWVH